jgi:DNA polymerase III delta prime subunit
MQFGTRLALSCVMLWSRDALNLLEERRIPLSLSAAWQGRRKEQMRIIKQDIESMLFALTRLDGLLAKAVERVRNSGEPSIDTDPFRGLHIGPAEVAHLLARTPGTSVLWVDDGGVDALRPERGSGLRWLVDTFGLSGFDVDVILLALAPEIDLRYERLYAYLQDDVTRRRPTVDLALSLLCETAEEKIVRRCHFAATGTLVRCGLLDVVSDPQRDQAPLLARTLILDEQVLGWLLGQDGLAMALIGVAQLLEPCITLAELWLDTECKRAMAALVRHAHATAEPFCMYLCGQDGSGKQRVAEALAKDNALLLLSVGLSHTSTEHAMVQRILQRALHECRYRNAILYVEHMDTVLQPLDDGQSRDLLCMLTDHAGIVILGGRDPNAFVARGLSGVMNVNLAPAERDHRLLAWRTILGSSGTRLAESDIATLANRYRLNPGQIVNAHARARDHARWRVATRSPATLSTHVDALPEMSELVRAARDQAGHALARLARKVDAKFSWEQLVLPLDQRSLLQDLVNQAHYRHVVHEQWGFARKLAHGSGLNAMFTGPPGTGKTMAAQVIAQDLQQDLYKIDLAQIVSKYIGETEKNLDRIFAAAENANAILFFDEADALFGKRSEVKDAHDRHANIEVSYLLQKLEEHDGIAILATNLRQHIDPAFMRRMQVVVEFPVPDELCRRQIWAGGFPSTAPLADDVDLPALAREVSLVGGNIRNICLAAAFYAASEGSAIRMQHILRATRREYQKLGRTWEPHAWHDVVEAAVRKPLAVASEG